MLILINLTYSRMMDPTSWKVEASKASRALYQFDKNVSRLEPLLRITVLLTIAPRATDNEIIYIPAHPLNRLDWNRGTRLQALLSAHHRNIIHRLELYAFLRQGWKRQLGLILLNLTYVYMQDPKIWTVDASRALVARKRRLDLQVCLRQGWK